VCALCKCITSLIFVTHVRAIIARSPQELEGPGSLNRLNPRFLRNEFLTEFSADGEWFFTAVHAEEKNEKTGATSVYIFKVFIKYHLNLGSGCISMFSVNLTFDKTAQLMQHVGAHSADMLLSAKIFKLNFEYLHIYSPKSGDFCRKNSKIVLSKVTFTEKH